MSSVEVSRAGQCLEPGDALRRRRGSDARPPVPPPGAAELRVVETTSEQVEADDNEGQPSDFGRGHQALTRNRVERFAP